MNSPLVFLKGSYLGVLVETHRDHGVTMLVVRTPGGSVRTVAAPGREEARHFVGPAPDLFSVDQVKVVHPERLKELHQRIYDHRRSGEEAKVQAADAMLECLHILGLVPE